MSQVIDRMAAAPARVFRLPAGTLSVGAAADITIIDPKQEWTVESEKFYTRVPTAPSLASA